MDEKHDEKQLELYQPCDEIYQSEPTRREMLDAIVDMYRFMFKTEEKHIWEKTPEDIQRDVAKSGFMVDLTPEFKNTAADIINKYKYDQLVIKKTTFLPSFLNMCYSYYIDYYKDNTPFSKLPTNVFKYRLFSSMVQANNVEINKIFEQIINDATFKEMRAEEPPYYLLTDKTPIEIKKIMSEQIKPVCKSLLEQILKLQRFALDIVETRNDNLD